MFAWEDNSDEWCRLRMMWCGCYILLGDKVRPNGIKVWFFLRELEFIAHADVQQKKYIFILLKNKSVAAQLTCQIPSLVCVIFSIDITFLSFWDSAVVWGGVCSITYSLNITDDPRRRDVGGLNKLELAEFWWMKWNRNFQSLLKWSEAFGCE